MRSAIALVVLAAGISALPVPQLPEECINILSGNEVGGGSTGSGNSIGNGSGNGGSGNVLVRRQLCMDFGSLNSVGNGVTGSGNSIGDGSGNPGSGNVLKRQIDFGSGNVIGDGSQLSGNLGGDGSLNRAHDRYAYVARRGTNLLSALSGNIVKERQLPDPDCIDFLSGNAGGDGSNGSGNSIGNGSGNPGSGNVLRKRQCSENGSGNSIGNGQTGSGNSIGNGSLDPLSGNILKKRQIDFGSGNSIGNGQTGSGNSIGDGSLDPLSGNFLGGREKRQEFGSGNSIGNGQTGSGNLLGDGSLNPLSGNILKERQLDFGSGNSIGNGQTGSGNSYGPHIIQTSSSQRLNRIGDGSGNGGSGNVFGGLAEDSWQESTALLVFPGGRDLPYCADLNGLPNAHIRHYVERGGRYLGICAGAYYASRRVEFEVGSRLEVIGDRELCFFPGICAGATWPGFVYDSEAGARNAKIALDPTLWSRQADWDQAPRDIQVYWNGGGSFLMPSDPTNDQRVKIVGRYDELPDKPAAGVLCHVGNGQALLWSVHPEHDLLPGADKEYDGSLLRASLRLMGLRSASTAVESPIIRPQIVLSARQSLRHLFKRELSACSTDNVLVDASDRFRLASDPGHVGAEERGIVFPAGQSATAEGFEVENYFDMLPGEGDFGKLLLYSPVVSSTQTLLDKNPRFLACCPSGLVSVALRQVAGRGRGSNAWLSPAGCLCFSLVVKAPARVASGIVFAQYLFALAVYEGVRSLAAGCDVGVRLKWPNDVYADLGASVADGKLRYKKLGGILVNTSFAGGDFTLVIGCGLNVLNEQPTLALRDLVPSALKDHISLERVLASVLPAFERLWAEFTDGDATFARFAERYTAAWIHSGQEIEVAATGQRVRIIGITSDHGLLRTTPISGSGDFVDLQPDGNSFDMLKGLVTVKR